MDTQPEDKSSSRPLTKVIAGIEYPMTGDELLARRFDASPAASQLLPLPQGQYEVRVSDSKLRKSTGGHTVYTLELTVLGPPEFAGRKLWRDFFLTEKALTYTKRDLALLKITDFEQLKRPFPANIVLVGSVVVHTSDDGRQRNRVGSLHIVRVEPIASNSHEDPDFPPKKPDAVAAAPAGPQLPAMPPMPLATSAADADEQIAADPSEATDDATPSAKGASRRPRTPAPDTTMSLGDDSNS
jgi:hypothetical protein